MGVTVFAFVSDVGVSALMSLCLFVFRFCSACVIIEFFGQDDRLVVIALFGPVGWGRFGRVGWGRFIAPSDASDGDASSLRPPALEWESVRRSIRADALEELRCGGFEVFGDRRPLPPADVCIDLTELVVDAPGLVRAGSAEAGPLIRYHPSLSIFRALRARIRLFPLIWNK